MEKDEVVAVVHAAAEVLVMAHAVVELSLLKIHVVQHRIEMGQNIIQH